MGRGAQRELCDQRRIEMGKLIARRRMLSPCSAISVPLSACETYE